MQTIALLLFIWDILGSCIAEATGDIMEKFVETELPGIPHTNRFSPGYCGWHVNEQKLLFSLLPDNVCGITLNSSAYSISFIPIEIEFHD